MRAIYIDLVSASLAILKKNDFPATVTLDLNITYLATAKISPREIIKISPSTKINPLEIWHIFHP